MSKSRLIGLTNRALMLIAAGLLVFSYLSILVNPAKMWLVSVAGILFVPLSLINLILLVWAILRRSKAFVRPRGGDQEAIVICHAEGVLLKLGQLTRAAHRIAVDHKGREDLGVAVRGVRVEIIADHGTLQACAEPAVEMEARARDLCGGIGRYR